jgi:hypothetical protein
MEGMIVALYIAPRAHAPMNEVTTAHLVQGRGIEGDRFFDLLYHLLFFVLTLMSVFRCDCPGDGGMGTI